MKIEDANKAKPFIKWAGGKTQLLKDIETLLPQQFINNESTTYIEPFVGGGAVLFHLLTHYPNIKKAIINDINPRLCTTYRVIKEQPHYLIEKLRKLQEEYLPLIHDERTQYFLEKRKLFNTDSLSDLDIASLFIFLNRTCFNGIYRENSKGQFNVPHGKYVKPCICDEPTILADSEALQRVTILCGDFKETLLYADQNTFFYFDPPYRPLSQTSSFNTYVKEPFDDAEQIRLRNFVNQIHHAGHSFVLSNSDVKSVNPNDNFFDDLYADYHIYRVQANRMVNSNASRRGKLSELMITNNPQSFHGMMAGEPTTKYNA